MKNVLALQKLALPAGLSAVAGRKSASSKNCGPSGLSLLLCKKA